VPDVPNVPLGDKVHYSGKARPLILRYVVLGEKR